MKKFFVLIVALFVSLSISAQNYKSALGLKFAYDAAITYKTFVSGTNALDFAADFRIFDPDVFSVSASAFYEWDNPIASVDGLSWYYGPGANLGIVLANGGGSSLFASINAILGIEYKIASLPLAISLDWTPGLRLTQGLGFHWQGGGLGVKYTF